MLRSLVGSEMCIRDSNKYPCFLCLWDSRASKEHYTRRQWPIRNELEPGHPNFLLHPLIEPKNVLLPPLHIKLGIMKNFIRALNKDGDVICYLKNAFQKLSDGKIEAGTVSYTHLRAHETPEHLVC